MSDLYRKGCLLNVTLNSVVTFNFLGHINPVFVASRFLVGDICTAN